MIKNGIGLGVNIWQLLLLAICASCTIFVFAPFGYYLLLVPILLVVILVLQQLSAIANRPLLQILIAGYVFGLAFYNSNLYWIFYSVYYVMSAKFIVAMIAQVGFTLFLASYFALTFVCYIKLCSKNDYFNLLLLLPSIWVFSDWFRGWFLGGFSWCDFGYALVGVDIFRGLFALFGEYAVTWICLSAIAALFILLNNFYKRLVLTRANKLIFIYILVIFVILKNIAPIEYTKPYGRPVTMAMLQGNIPVDTKWQSELNLQVYYRLIARANADIIMLPETAISQFAMNLPSDFIAKITALARSKNASLIVGMPKIIDADYHYINTATELTSNNHPFYAKYHLVPYGEYIPAKWLFGVLYRWVSLPMVDFTPGAKRQKPLVVANQKIAFNICYENGFNSELIYGAKQSTIMANLSDMVWYGDTIAMDQHLLLSRARALENQRYFVQDTNTSITAVIDNFGQIHSQLPIFKREILTDYVQGMVGTTPFEVYGNWPIISFCTAIILAAVMMLCLL